MKIIDHLNRILYTVGDCMIFILMVMPFAAFGFVVMMYALYLVVSLFL